MLENKNIIFVLVRPQLGENIGAVARVMLNFGYNNLRIINPRDNWPNKAALANAAGANVVIENALIFENLEDALTDIDIVYATTNRKRNLNIETSSIRNLKNLLNAENKIAILFGAENNGLSNSELIYADKLICIDTNEKFSSLNIAQALGIIAYEISNCKNIYKRKLNTANKKDLAIFTSFITQNLIEKNFFKTKSSNAKKLKISNIFNRIDNLTIQDLKLLYGIVRSLKN